MKKTKIAVGVIVALGALWTGASWYTGKQIESKMDTLVKKGNQRLNDQFPGKNLTLSYTDYTRGIFSSSVKLQLHAPAMTYGNAQDITVGFLEDIAHGPFPLTKTASFSLRPVLASIHSTLENNDSTKQLFDITKGQSLFEADTIISYSGFNSTALKFIPVSYQDQQENKLTSDGALFTINSDRDGSKNDMTGNIGKLTFSGKGDQGQPVSISSDNMTWNANTVRSTQGLTLGDQVINLKNLHILVDNTPTVALEGFNLKTSFNENDKKINGYVDYTLSALRVKNINMGEGQLLLKIENLDADALKTFTTNVSNQLKEVSNDPEVAQNSELFAIAQRQTITDNLPVLLKGEPSISLAPLSWKNSKGESTLTVKLLASDPSTPSNATGQSLPQVMLDSVVKSLEANAKISVDMITEAITQGAILEGTPPQEAANLATEQAQGLVATGKLFKLITVDNNIVSSTLSYADGKVTLNGKTSSVDQFIGNYLP